VPNKKIEIYFYQESDFCTKTSIFHIKRNWPGSGEIKALGGKKYRKYFIDKNQG